VVHILDTNAVFGYACAELRPQWNGIKVTDLQEALVLASTPVSLALVMLSMVALWQRRLWLTLILCLGWCAWVIHIIFDDMMNRANFTAQKIGCVGTSLTYLVIGSTLCAAILAVTLFHKPKVATQ